MPGNISGLEAPSTAGEFAFGILQTEGIIPGVGTAVPLSIPSLDSSPQGEQKTSMPISMTLGDPPLPHGPHPSLLSSNQQQPYQQNMQQVQQQQSLPQQMTSLPLQPSNLPQLEDISDEDIGPLSPLAVSLAAGFSGSPAASASHGFDTAKSRSQCMVLPKRGFLKWQLPGKRFESWTGIHPADRNILFHGLGLRMARSGIASFVVVGGYLFAIDKLLSE
ncbi:hypothetical protein CQW23_19598 [Capsicum baccatum]|uniref:Uncharacterized protein n=1 Tax=Capsicum baccatum TaxID=33114 RepID=A0A2G2W6A6_CAPBA|nr:hypothetical protein CQW23_19598 [Capsicum baccatum]